MAAPCQILFLLLASHLLCVHILQCRLVSYLRSQRQERHHLRLEAAACRLQDRAHRLAISCRTGSDARGLFGSINEHATVHRTKCYCVQRGCSRKAKRKAGRQSSMHNENQRLCPAVASRRLSSGSRKLLRQMPSGVEFEFCRRGSSTEKSCNNGRQVGDALHARCEAHEHIAVMARNKY